MLPAGLGQGTMIEDAFMALEMIQQRPSLATPELDTWIDAFTTISWAVRTGAGVRLTAAGKQAYQTMAGDRRIRIARRA